MKILHTSDWHIGKKLMGRERYDEYESMLDEIYQISKAENVELILVAGDIFDTYTPTSQAEEIFYSAVKKLSTLCAVLIISGNHDDYVRLTAARAIAQELNVYIIGNNLQAISCEKRGNCYPVLSDSGYVVFENAKGDRVYINTLPYPNEARFKEGKTDESFVDKIQRWIDFGERGKTEKMPSIFLSHIFVNGGKVTGTEREIDLGGARLVGVSQLPKCDYVALGHLHRGQNIKGGNIYYSGAPMRFSFDEANADKWVNVFDLSNDGLQNFKQVYLKNIKNLVKLQANDVHSGLSLLENNIESYVELTLNLLEPLTPEQSQTLRSVKNLISLKCNVQNGDSTQLVKVNSEQSASSLFDEFYKNKYGIDAPEKLKELFLSLTEEE